jgi:tRNA-binding protein
MSDVQPWAPTDLAAKPDIGADAFFSVDMRVGEILDVEAFPEARKPAWKLTVDFGPVIGTRRTSAQITNYSEDELVGRKVVGALNLGAKRIAGFRSEFLVLGSMDPHGLVRLLQVEDDAPLGAAIA